MGRAKRTALDRSMPAATRADEFLLSSLDPDKRDALINALNQVLQAVGNPADTDHATAA